MSHAASVQVQPPNGAAFNVHTHAVVVRNAGRAPATNVRLSHALLPQNFSVFPSVPYTIENLQGGSADIVFPKLVPGEQVSITYLYYPPVLFSHINTNARSDEGFAKIVTVLWSPQPPKWLQRLALALMSVGVIAIVYALWCLCSALWSAYGH